MMKRFNFKNKKLWRLPDQGRIKGVCAGFADYLDVSVTLVRFVTVLSMVFGLFMFTLVAYIALAFILEPRPARLEKEVLPPSARDLLGELEHELQSNEQSLRDAERYITSETFSVRSRFRQL